jgi:hypothetical protein
MLTWLAHALGIMRGTVSGWSRVAPSPYRRRLHPLVDQAAHQIGGAAGGRHRRFGGDHSEDPAVEVVPL